MTLFSTEEQPLLTGTNEEIAAFIEVERCIIIDWKGTEEDTLWNVQQCLPEGAFDFQIAQDTGSEDLSLTIRFQSRENVIALPPRPQNCFRVLLPINGILLPNYEIKLFRCTEGDDTHAFLLRPAEWWDAFRDRYPARLSETFSDLDALSRLWDLDATPAAIPATEPAKIPRPWWRFW